MKVKLDPSIGAWAQYTSPNLSAEQVDELVNRLRAVGPKDKVRIRITETAKGTEVDVVPMEMPNGG